MPRPSTNDSIDTSQEFQQRLNPTTNSNTSLIVNNDIINSNSSPDYQHQSSSTPIRLVQQTSLSSTHSDDNISNIFSLSMQEQLNDTTTSSSNSIPISRNNLINNSNLISPINSPIESLNSTSRPAMEDKSIQCINEDDENSIEQEEINDEHLETKKRSNDDENWITEVDR